MEILHFSVLSFIKHRGLKHALSGLACLALLWGFLLPGPLTAQEHREGYMLDKKSNQIYYFHIIEDSTVYVREGMAGGGPALALPPFVVETLYERLRTASDPDSAQIEEQLAISFEDGTISFALTQQAVLLLWMFVPSALSLLLFVWAIRKYQKERKRREVLVASREHLVEGREKERQHIARELHDGPIQDLHGLRVYLGTRGMAKNGFRRDDLNQAEEEILQVVRELRALSENLRPPSLGPFGLGAALEAFGEHFRGRHPATALNLSVTKDGPRLPEQIRLSLFRIGQEAMNNAAQHAQANQVSVDLTMGESRVVLEINDDGKGFEVPEDWNQFAGQGHYGLIDIVERAEAISADLEVQSALGEGTHLRVTMPIARIKQNGVAEDRRW